MSNLTGIPMWPELRMFYDEARCTIVLETGTSTVAVPLFDAYALQGMLARAVRQCELDS